MHPGRARLLLKQGNAAVWRRFPFTIILAQEVQHPQVQPLRLKIDPGSKTTGLALVNDASGEVVFAAELTHRGQAIKNDVDSRRAVRRGRRGRKTRYRKARFHKRRRPQGWLPPSLESRIQNILTWVVRLRRSAPVMAISQELVRFDTQAMDNPAIQAGDYQQGMLAGYEVREFLLEKWGRRCAYCGKENVPLQREHLVPRAKGGSNRISNLTLACGPCNQAKGTRDLADFLKEQPALLKKILGQAKAPLADAAAVNSTRWQLYERLQRTGLPVEVGSVGLTKYNRSRRELPKTHWLDAVCVGRSTPEVVEIHGMVPLLIKAQGHGSRQMCLPDRFGFPRTAAKGARKVKGFQTGDVVRALVTKGKKQGTYSGRVAVRTSGAFNITTEQGTVQGIGHQYCQLLHKSDGYSYQKGMQHSSHA